MGSSSVVVEIAVSLSGLQNCCGGFTGPICLRTRWLAYRVTAEYKESGRQTIR
jgi:hypothetical protein